MTMMMIIIIIIVFVHFTAFLIDFCAERSWRVFMDVASGILIFRAVNAV